MYEHTISKLEPECRQLACRLSTRLRVVFSAFCSTRSWVLRNTCTGVPLEIAGFLQGCSHGRLRSKDSQGRAPDRTSRSRSQERRCSRRCQEVRHLRKKEEQLRTTEEQLREEKLIGLRASGTASSAAGSALCLATVSSEEWLLQGLSLCSLTLQAAGDSAAVHQIRLTDSKTYYLVVHACAGALLPQDGSQPCPAVLIKILRHVVAAYVTKTTSSLEGAVSTIWAQCAAQLLLLSRMLQVDCGQDCFIPVFGGDLNCHMVLHQPQDNLWHVASSQTSPQPEEQTMYGCEAVPCMRRLSERPVPARATRPASNSP
ncbi:hypothetical protein WJX74_000395 [Apatococcus lobatus]|uniref:Uncharacterized protein n=1 Tax=Apatococcus lobatus TaxID=904363 RepID=A0AAW1QVE6_9CHLO